MSHFENSSNANFLLYETLVQRKLKDIVGCKQNWKFSARLHTVMSNKSIMNMVQILPDEILKKIASFHSVPYDLNFFHKRGKYIHKNLMWHLKNATIDLNNPCNCGKCNPVFDKPYSSSIRKVTVKCFCCPGPHTIWQYARSIESHGFFSREVLTDTDTDTDSDESGAEWLDEEDVVTDSEEQGDVEE